MRAPSQPLPDADARAAALEDLLRELADAHAQLLDLAAEHRAAISRADSAAIAAAVARQAPLAERARAADARRAQLVRAWMPDTPGATLADLASTVEEPARARLLALGAAVRELLHRLARENRTVREAADALLAHMDGLVRQVARRLAHSATYSRRGGAETATPLAAGLDLQH